MSEKKIDTRTVRHVATLARLEMSDQETALYEEQLNAILGYVEKLQELDTSDIQPLAHIAASATPMREDVPAAGLGEKCLTNAPDREERFFKVPQVIE
ncbi:MAG: Asp-tRNA(Asn)/Glu-tRNA(Gln) amidotransferase subunit GatC [Deltaproteobacteria bacterium]|nr:Asp-tRNA(Asn)/Glu-tRNA(Gln) amidotransferase subunit GatC [Deltaproteobacteria bacterium]